MLNLRDGRKVVENALLGQCTQKWEGLQGVLRTPAGVRAPWYSGVITGNAH
jgi:hypothetical protein